MNVYQIDPLKDSRWAEFVETHPQSSIFHTSGWLQALQSTYGYEPIAFTSSEPSEPLQNALLFAKISSWLTGNRIVSLPFSDHCAPLVDRDATYSALMDFAIAQMKLQKWKYVEIRPLSSSGEAERSAAFGPAETFAFHMVDLRPELDVLLKTFHKSCVQRKLTKAEKEGLQYSVGRSEELIENFYRLLLVTRRRHQLPPQPRVWFRNLVRTLGDNLQIHLVAKDSQPIATILTLRNKKTLVYKYGCSDSQYNKYGGTILLFWRAIQEAKSWGAESFDLGRSETSNSGLIEFKGHWGAPLQQIHYYRYPAKAWVTDGSGWKMRLVHNACSRLPDPVLQSIGNVLYRHVG